MHSILKPLPFLLGVAILGCFVYFSIVRTPAYSEPDIPFELHQVNTHLAQLQNRVKQLDALRANAEFHEERLIKLLQTELVQCAGDSGKAIVLNQMMADAKERKTHLQQTVLPEMKGRADEK